MPSDADRPMPIAHFKHQLITTADEIAAMSIRSVLIDPTKGTIYRVMMNPNFGHEPYLRLLTPLAMHAQVSIRHKNLFDNGPLLVVWTPDAIAVEVPGGPHLLVPHLYQGNRQVGKIVPPCELCGRAYFHALHTKVN